MNRTIRSAIAMATGLAVLVGMFMWGYKSLTKPFPKTASTTKTTCQNKVVTRKVTRAGVTVSVFNASNKKGLAGTTMKGLQKRGFAVGTIGNAPQGVSTDYVTVLSGDATDPTAKLVALQFNPPATVVASAEQYGPGYDIILGKKFTKLPAKGPKALRLDKPRVSCRDN